ncbi:DUF349 domain-containing protein [Brachybacterium sp. NPDC056505]|uniref:DUF349 domain-containing protein n=1 Tax=Brachybacterium sp. NPDC056505 TaxID=3345843 RepID=UPI003671AFD7
MSESETPDATAPDGATPDASTTEGTTSDGATTQAASPDAATEGATPDTAPETATSDADDETTTPEAASESQSESGTSEAAAPESAGPAAPAPRPTPRPTPRPGTPSPAALAGRRPSAPLIPVAPPVQEYDDTAIQEALAFGTLEEDGTVSVQDGTQKRSLGTAVSADREEALAPFARAYLDLVAFLDVTQQRLAAPQLTQADLNRLLENLRKNMKEPQVIGDIPALRARASELRENAKEKIHALEEERLQARDAATAERTAFVESIEQLVETEPERMSWKSAGETMRGMVGTWKSMQKEGPSLERSTEDALWKRLSTARSAFDRKRRQFFSHLDEQHAEAEKVREDIIRRAEEMKDSTDWGPTVRAYRSLMDEWRAAPRGNRKKDDAQWARFKAAQDTFFAARNEDLAASDAEQKENLKVKEALLAEAEAVDPAEDLDGARAALHRIQDRWDEAGKVPRGDMRRIEDRLRTFERSLKQAEDAEWRRTDPRTRARVEGASSQLQEAISSYEDDLEKARATGDPAKIAKAEEALRARREWLEVIERSARDLG